jgi:hypothetical protein
VSPRKSSTSSGRRSAAPRPRYLGLEVAGEHLPAPSPRWWETTLRARAGLGPSPFRFRLIRVEGPRAVVEVDQRTLAVARTVWPGTLEPGTELVSVRTWGTLVGAKAWLRDGTPPAVARRPT